MKLLKIQAPATAPKSFRLCETVEKLHVCCYNNKNNLYEANVSNFNLIKIREYVPSDWSAIEYIHDKARIIELRYANLETAFVPLEIAAKREKLFDYDGLFVTEIGSVIVGFVACTKTELAWLYISPEYMRRGIGRALARRAMSSFPSINYTEVLKGNEPAKKLYERLEFITAELLSGRCPAMKKFRLNLRLDFRL